MINTFRSDITIMDKLNMELPSMWTSRTEVGLYSTILYTKYEAIESMWEEALTLPYAEDLMKPKENQVEKVWIKNNPAADDNLDEEDAYIFTKENDPNGIQVWWVPFITSE